MHAGAQNLEGMMMKNKQEFCVLSKTLIAQIEEKLIKWQATIETAQTSKEELAMENSSEIIDQANKETMLSLEIEKNTRNSRVLAEIRTALKKIKDGTYGICEESGEPIEQERLVANPLARFTIDAQQELENEMKNRKKN